MRGSVKTRSDKPAAGQVDVDVAERYLMNHRGWCGAPDGTACEGCRQTAIEGVEALRSTGRLKVPQGITSFVGLRAVYDVHYFHLAADHPDVRLVSRVLKSSQCMGTPVEAAQVIVAALIRTGLLEPAEAV